MLTLCVSDVNLLYLQVGLDSVI